MDRVTLPVFLVHVWLSLLDCTRLDCFSCREVDTMDNCHSIQTCSETQICYTQKYSQNGTMVFNLGCRNEQACVGYDVTDLLGRRQTDDSTPCTQCCSGHGCNKNLCPVIAYAQPVDGGWSAWTSWGDCEPSCGIGLRFRHRACDNPPPSGKGQQCPGDDKGIAICNNPCTDPPSTTTQAVTTKNTPYMDPDSTTLPTHYYTNDLTQAPGQCDDLIDCSGYYRPKACVGIYSAWAHRYCPVHCGFCPTPSPIPCVDTIDNCHEYEVDMCTREEFWQWRESHCRKYCDLC